MLTVAALIGDPVKVGHATQKLRARGIPPGAIRPVARDPAAAREVAAGLVAGTPAVMIVTGTLAGALVGAMGGWVAITNTHPLAGPAAAAQALGPTGAAIGLALGLAVGAILGWLLGRLATRRKLASFAEGVAAGDTLLVADVAESQLREVEDLLRSYGARSITSGPARATPAPGPTTGEPAPGPESG
jgi:hypothetical protein